jgi:hypothetical protein
MALNKEGIAQLKFDLRANAERYNQDTFGRESKDCGTVCCMAGLCLRRQMGDEEFKYGLQRVFTNGSYYKFGRVCIQAAAKQLGMVLLSEKEYSMLMYRREGLHGTTSTMPAIFSSVDYWPRDLRHMYGWAYCKGDRQAVAEVACMALDRMDVNGFIAELAVKEVVEAQLCSTI